ncbi:hypothetical protein GCM10023185_01840 [Hymenobacter saemangeumensis]|uniref:Uncharacterized protein n=1 Tax=Hymenobacter saemangeumensis TaxID=1084522 RepID=A0ABP8HXX7_9BACT
MAANSALAQTITVASVSKEAYLRALKSRIDTKPKVTYPLKKQAGRIVIPTAEGKSIFQDRGLGAEGDEENMGQYIYSDAKSEYSYGGYWPQLSLHSILGNYRESGRDSWEEILVGDNGQRLHLPGGPNFSPDMRCFVVESADLGVHLMPNVIQLYQLKNDIWRKIWEVQPKTWEPAEAFWTAENVLFLKKKLWKAGKATGAFTYSKITIQ